MPPKQHRAYTFAGGIDQTTNVTINNSGGVIQFLFFFALALSFIIIVIGLIFLLLYETNSTLFAPSNPPIIYSNYTDVIIADGPWFYWKTNETGSIANASDQIIINGLIYPKIYDYASVNNSNNTGFYSIVQVEQFGGVGFAFQSPGIINTSETTVKFTPNIPYNMGGMLQSYFGNGFAPNYYGYVFNQPIFSIELWFSTITTTGGVLFGFMEGSPLGPLCCVSDATIWLDPLGRIAYGTYNNIAFNTMITSLSYNDGLSHHVVITDGTSTSGSVLYIDGQAIWVRGARGFDSTIGVFYSGFNNYIKSYINLYEHLPTGYFLSATISDIAYYQYILTEDQVDYHYAVGMLKGNTNFSAPVVTSPSFMFGFRGYNLSLYI